MATKSRNMYMAEVLEWMQENFDGAYTVTINDDDEIVVNGDCILKNYELSELPYKFKEVTGDFILGGLRGSEPIPAYALNTLKNCPETVGGVFNCAFCRKLTSLAGGPKNVGRYICNGCSLSSLDGIALKIRNGEVKAFGNNSLVDISALELTEGLSTVDVDFASDFLYGSPSFKNLLNRNIISGNFQYADKQLQMF